MFGMDQTKTQSDEVPSSAGLAADVIVSADTQRSQRLPPGQTRTKKWPILDASGPPPIDLANWGLHLTGLVGKELHWNWEEFIRLPRTRVFSDFHCVTRWSRLGNLWGGVATRELVRIAGGAAPEARFVLVRGYDRNWTTNLPLEDFLAEDALVATHHDGQPISLEHGGPARLVIPRLYAWKSAKWIAEIRLMETDRAGFWEANGYHMHGDPWKEQRYSF